MRKRCFCMWVYITFCTDMHFREKNCCTVVLNFTQSFPGVDFVQRKTTRVPSLNSCLSLQISVRCECWCTQFWQKLFSMHVWLNCECGPISLGAQEELSGSQRNSNVDVRNVSQVRVWANIPPSALSHCADRPVSPKTLRIAHKGC